MYLIYMYAQFMCVIKFFPTYLTYGMMKMFVSLCFHILGLTNNNKKVDIFDMQRCTNNRSGFCYYYYATAMTTITFSSGINVVIVKGSGYLSGKSI